MFELEENNTAVENELHFAVKSINAAAMTNMLEAAGWELEK